MNEFKPIALDDELLFPVEHDQPERLVRPKTKAKVVTTEMLTSATCRWPFGDPAEKDFHYCGQVPQTGGIYCDTHDAMSRPAGPRRR